MFPRSFFRKGEKGSNGDMSRSDVLRWSVEGFGEVAEAAAASIEVKKVHIDLLQEIPLLLLGEREFLKMPPSILMRTLVTFA